MSSIVDETPLVPVIHKSEFDDVAAEFLTAYCPEALETPIFQTFIAFPLVGLKSFLKEELRRKMSPVRTTEATIAAQI